MKTRFLLGMTGVIVLALGLLGCGTTDDNGDAAPDGETSDEGADPEEEEPEDVLTLRWATPNPADSDIEAEFNAWAELVAEETNGQVEIEGHYTESLYPVTEGLSAMQDGRTDLGYMFSGYWPAEFPLWGSAGLPFQSVDPFGDVQSWRETYESNDTFRGEWEGNGIRPLAFLAFGTGVAGTSEPVTNLEDLEGLRLRAVGEQGVAFEAVGAEPVALPPAEIYEGVQRGVLDGFGTYPLGTVPSIGFHEVAPHILHHGMGTYGSLAVGMSEDAWADLPESVREGIERASERYAYERTDDELRQSVLTACEVVLDAGGSINVLPEDDLEEWRGLVEEQLLERWLAAAEEAGASREEAEGVHAERLEHYGDRDEDYLAPEEECAEL